MRPAGCCIALGAALAFALGATHPTHAATAFVIPLEMPIHPLAVEVVERGIDEARQCGASVIVVELNTPGGLMTSMEAIVSALIASPVPVVGYVAPSGGSADSAGFFILMACDVAAMAPGTNTGAAHPVSLFGGDDAEESVMARKIESAAAARIRSLVEGRGRNLVLAEEAVVKPRSFTADEALVAGLIELVAADLPELLAALQGRTVRRMNGTEVKLAPERPAVIRYELDRRQRLLAVVAHPELAYLLLLLGGLGLYIELTHPGLIFPGAFGVCALTVALYGMSVLPVNWLGLAAIVLGVALLVLEIKVTSYGALTAAGLAALVFGSLILFDGPVPELRVGLGVVLPGVAAVGLIVVGLMSAVAGSLRQRVSTGPEGLVGEEGKALSDVACDGQVFVHGEIWSASSRRAIAAGAGVRVLAVEGLRLEVEPGGGGARSAGPADGVAGPAQTEGGSA